jgi:hypothetical protein
LSAPVANAQISKGASAIAFHHDSILVGEGRHTDCRECLKHGRGERMRIRCRLYENGATRSATIEIGLAMPILDASINPQYGLVVPTIVAKLGR